MQSSGVKRILPVSSLKIVSAGDVSGYFYALFLVPTDKRDQSNSSNTLGLPMSYGRTGSTCWLFNAEAPYARTV